MTLKQLAAVLELHSKRGRDGCGPLRRQLERYFGIDGTLDSTLEQLFLDGPRHRRPEVAARDRRRDAFLRSLGWEVLRFDEEQVTFSPASSVAAVRRALRRDRG